MKVLLNYGADVNYPEMHHGNTALAAAAELGLPEVCQLLLGDFFIFIWGRCVWNYHIVDLIQN